MPDRVQIHLARPEEVLTSRETTLVEVVDRLLDAGVVIRGEIWLSVAEIDLVFLGANLVLASPETMKRVRTP